MQLECVPLPPGCALVCCCSLGHNRSGAVWPFLDASFVSGSHIGELIVWSALDWTMQASEWNFWDPSPQQDTQQEIKLCQKPNDISIHHFTCDEEVKPSVSANSDPQPSV